MLRICKVCGDVFEREDRLGPSHKTCEKLECIRIGAPHRLKNKVNRNLKQKATEKAAAWRAVLDQAKNVACMDCGGRFPACAMDFDHRPGTVKAFQLSNSSGRCPASVIREIEKCDVVCANCHRVRTFYRRKIKE